MQGLTKELVEPGNAHSISISVGGVSVKAVGDLASGVALAPSLELFRIEAGASDVTMSVEWTDSLSITCRRQLFDAGVTWRLYESDAGFQFDFSAPIIGEAPYKRLFVDDRFCRATLQMNAESFSRFRHVADPLEYPLDELLIMHRLTQERAIELHSCGIVGPDGAGNLFVGHSGAGKSTTTRLWTSLEDVEVLSDDRIIVRRDEESRMQSAIETPIEAAGTAHGRGVPSASSGQALRLHDCSASRTNHSAQDDRSKGKMRMYGTPWHGEAMYASPNSAPLSRVIILEHGHGNILTPLSPSQAVAELFARSFVPFHRHEYVDSALDFLQELAATVPVYRYSFEPTPQAVDKILDLHD